MEVRKVNYKVEIKLLDALTDPTNANYNELLGVWANKITRWSYDRYYDGSAYMYSKLRFLLFADFLGVMSTPGGAVFGYRAFIKLPEAQINDITPDYLPNRDTPQWDDTNQVELPPLHKTWNEWIGANYTKTLIDGFYYFCTQAGGVDLTNDQLLQLNTDGFIIVDEIPTIEEAI